MVHLQNGSTGEETGDIYFEVNYPFKKTSALAAVQPVHCKVLRTSKFENP